MRAKVQRRLKRDTAGALPFIHRVPVAVAIDVAVAASYPRKYKEEKLAKDGGEKAATTTGVKKRKGKERKT